MEQAAAARAERHDRERAAASRHPEEFRPQGVVGGRVTETLQISMLHCKSLSNNESQLNGIYLATCKERGYVERARVDQ